MSATADSCNPFIYVKRHQIKSAFVRSKPLQQQQFIRSNSNSNSISNSLSNSNSIENLFLEETNAAVTACSSKSVRIKLDDQKFKDLLIKNIADSFLNAAESASAAATKTANNKEINSTATEQEEKEEKYNNQLSLEIMNNKNNSNSCDNNERHFKELRNKNVVFFGKQPFLPRLPAKTNSYLFDTTHFISQFYVNNLNENNNAAQSGHRKQSAIKYLMTQQSRDECKHVNDTNRLYKGDLLKGGQVYSVLEKTCSESIRRIKTADSRWRRPTRANTIIERPMTTTITANSNIRSSSKPYKSALKKNVVESSSYLSSSRSTNTNMNISSANFIRQHLPTATVTVTANSTANAVSGLNLRRAQTFAIFNNKSSSNNDSEVDDQMMTINQTYKAVKLFSKYDRMQLYPEDLFNLFKETSGDLVDFNKEMTQQQQQNVALYALGHVWDLNASVLKHSPTLFQLYKKEMNKEDAEEIIIKHYQSTLKSTISKERLSQMKRLFLDVDDKLVNKHAFALALGSLYHSDIQVIVPGPICAETLAISKILKLNGLKQASIESMQRNLNCKLICNCCIAALKFNEAVAIELCEKWLEMHLTNDLARTIHLARMPLELLTKMLGSSNLFTLDEFDNFMLIANWIFLNMNPKECELPPETIVVAYFSSMPKDKTFTERYPQFKSLFYTIRLHGITRSYQIQKIQQMNIYTESYFLKCVIDIQQSLNNGGDMKISKVFESSAVRQGFVLNANQNYLSDTFSLYGFHFELIAEKIDNPHMKQFHHFKFYIQRLTSNNPMLSYEKTQLETISLRHERYCAYSINVYYLSNDHKPMMKTSGKRTQRFGRTQTSQPFDIFLPRKNNQLNNYDHDYYHAVAENNNFNLYVMYSFTYPPD